VTRSTSPDEASGVRTLSPGAPQAPPVTYHGSVPPRAAEPRSRPPTSTRVWAPRLTFFLCGTASLAWALTASRFRDAEGVLDGNFVLPLALGGAFLVLAGTTSGSLRAFGRWFALALVGQAVALQLIDAGPRLHYQHYRALQDLTPAGLPLLAFLLAQAALVGLGLRRRGRRLFAWLEHNLGRWRLAALALVFVLSSAALSQQVTTYVADLIFAAFVQIVNLANLVLLASALPEERLQRLRRGVERWIQGSAAPRHAPSPGGDTFVLAAAGAVVVLAALLTLVSYERHPHVPDEVAYLFQARYMAEGKLWLPAPPIPDAFEVNLLHSDGNRWYSLFPPGWPAVLAVGVRAGVPWLVNPLLAGLNVWLVYVLLRRLYDRRSARLAVLLLCASPWYLFTAMSFMAHTFSLTCALVAAVAITSARHTGRVAYALLAGAALGGLGLVRPLDGFILAALLGLWSLGLGGHRLKGSSIAALAASALAVSTVGLIYNALLTGHPAEFPLTAYFDQRYGRGTNAFGFGPERGVGWGIDPFPGHGPLDALVNAGLNVFSINIELLGWSTGSLLLAALVIVSGRWSTADRLMLACLVAVAGAHSFYWFSGGPDFGARYWFLALVPLLALTVSGIRLLEQKLERQRAPAARALDPVAGDSADTRIGEDASRESGGTRILVAVLALCALTMLNYVPWRAVDKYHHYRGMRPDVRALAQTHGFGKSLVLVSGKRRDYASAAVYNPLDLRDDAPVYAWDRSPAVRAAVLRAYPERPVWIVRGPTLTGRGFSVVAGPIAPRDAPTRPGESLAARRTASRVSPGP
jgi:hypothetical protein